MSADGRGPRVLHGAADDAERFALPMVEKGAPRGPARLRPLTASQLEALQREAYAEAFEQGRREGDERGYEEGRKRAETEARPLAASLQAMLKTLAEPLSRLDDEVEENLVALAFACTRQLVRRELRTDPGQVIGAVREALAALPIAAREVRVHLNREDVARVRDALLGDADAAGWRIVEDAAVSRGGCRVESEYSRVDASVEGRLQAIFAQVLGGERSADGAETDAPARDETDD